MQIGNPRLVGNVGNVHSVGNQNQRVRARARHRVQFFRLRFERIVNMPRNHDFHRLSAVIGLRQSFCLIRYGFCDFYAFFKR